MSLLSFLFRNPLNKLRGWSGEQKAALWMWLSLDADVYRRFHDIIIPAKNGTAQIDHLLVSKYGIFIIETKNRNGWIFGSEDQKTWTQVVFGKKYQFQNPIHQAYRQKKTLAEFLDISVSKVHVVIYFNGDCKFKTPMPGNVRNSGLASYIESHKQEILNSEERERILQKMQKHLAESTLTKADHLKSLKERHNSTTICPRCGGQLIERTAKTGKHVGSRFLGCQNFPKCRFTKKL
jgi:predicted RNA-binding Zn-ribbon protein involved in translation (DUF1610 family)